MFDDFIDRDALLRVFATEAEENIAVMEESLVTLEQTPGDEALLNTIFRAAHTLKGNCASVGLDCVVELAHATEDLLHALRSKRFGVTRELITLLLRAADALESIIPRAMAAPETPPAPDAELLAALREAARTGECSTRARAAEQGGERAGAARGNSVRVAARKLDVLLETTSELSVARGRVRALCEARGELPVDLGDALDQLDHLTDVLQDLVLQTRMVPIGPVLRQQVRTARDLASREGKLVAVEIRGEDVELDTSVVERLKDPLTHMIRNAVDHGVEPAAVRKSLGKNEHATISLRASHREAMIVVEVADDGAGIDKAKLLQRAAAMQLEVASLSDRDLFRLILLPGFSTATNVTEVSGRGIGLDVVEKNISAVGGSITIDSELGKGTTFTIRLPLTVAVLRGLSVRVAHESYVVPLSTVTECLDLPEEARFSSGRSGVLKLRGEALPFLRLRHCFESGGRAQGREKVVVVEYDRRRAALVVDELLGEVRAVVKPMSRLFRRTTAISGAALLGGGDIGLVLEIASILDGVAASESVHQELAEVR